MTGPQLPAAVQRTIRNNPELRRKCADEMATTFNSNLSFSYRPNAKYGQADFHRIMMGAVALNSTVYGYAESMRRCKTNSLGLGKGHRMVPSGEWATNICQQIRPEDMMKAFADMAASQVEQMHDLGMMQDSVIDIACDMHLEQHWHKKHGTDLIRSKSNGRTGLFARYITAQSTKAGEQLILAGTLMPALEETSDYVRMMVSDCRKAGVEVGIITLDRGFFSTSVIKTFGVLGVGYLIPCINTSKVVEAIREFAAKKRPAVSRCRITSASGDSVEYYMIITRRKKRKKKDSNLPEDRYIAFATNRPWEDVKKYARRWMIETGYRMVKNMQVKTRSRNHVYRTFCFLYSLAVYNAWVLVNAENRWLQKMMNGKYRNITQTDLKVLLLRWLFSGEWNWKGPPGSIPHTSTVGPVAVPEECSHNHDG